MRRKLFWIGFSVAGQLADVAMTHVGVKHFGLSEKNPMIAPMIARDEWAKLYAIKAGLGAGLPLLESAAKRDPELIVKSARMSGIVGFSAAAWNISQMIRARRRAQATRD